jgi:hypothetical protein
LFSEFLLQTVLKIRFQTLPAIWPQLVAKFLLNRMYTVRAIYAGTCL